MRKGILTCGFTASAMLLGVQAPASADAVADFYTGKTVTILVGAGPGGNHSHYSLLLAPYFKKNMPGHPNFIIKNMGGAGGTKAANYLYNSAPQDGSHIGILLSDTAMAGRLRAVGIKYDAKKFHFLGGADYTRSMITVMKTAGVNSIADAKKTQVIMGSTGKASQTYTIPIVVNYFLGTKFKVITGYRGMNAVDAAVEKGEVQGRAGVYSSMIAIRPHWLEKKLVTHLAIADLEPNSNTPGVPLLIDMAKDKDARDVMTLIFGSGMLGRGWLAPPGVPKDRVTAFRAAFWKSFNDPEAQAGMKKRRMHFSPVRWEKQQEAVTRIANTPDRIILLARKALGLKSK